MNIKTIKKLILTLAFAIIFISANNALAYVPGVWDPTPRVNSNEPGFIVIPTTVDKPVVPQTTSTTVATNTTTTTQTPKTVARATTVQRTVVASNTQAANAQQFNQSQLPPAQTINQPYNGAGYTGPQNNISALSVAGSGGFMPSSIWQWLFVILLILAVIIIIRTFTKSPHQEMHTMSAH